MGSVVNAAGPRAAELASLAGVPDLPVRPKKRIVYRIQSPADLPGCPLVIDPSGVYFRPEGDGFLCGVSPPESRDPDTLDLEMEFELFHELVWPTLAHRVPAFDSLRLGPSWAGHYAFNPLGPKCHPRAPPPDSESSSSPTASRAMDSSTPLGWAGPSQSSSFTGSSGPWI